MKTIIYILIISIFLSCETSLQLIEESDAQSNGATRSEVGNPGDSNNQNPTVAVNNIEKQVHILVNEHRAKRGLKKLQWHDEAIIQSQDHSQDMASFRVPFGHTGFSNRINRIEARDPQPILSSGENVAWNSADENSTAQKVMQQWLGSPGHRANIEGFKFTHTGIGAVKSANGRWYYTQIFLQK